MSYFSRLAACSALAIAQPALAQAMYDTDFASPASVTSTHQFSCTDATGKAMDGVVSHTIRKSGIVFKDTLVSFVVRGKPMPRQDLARIQAAINGKIVDIVTPGCNRLGGVRVELRVWIPAKDGPGKLSAITVTRSADGKVEVR